MTVHCLHVVVTVMCHSAADRIVQGAPECMSYTFNADGKCTSFTGGTPAPWRASICAFPISTCWVFGSILCGPHAGAQLVWERLTMLSVCCRRGDGQASCCALGCSTAEDSFLRFAPAT